jgi:hypothetical protein
MATKSVSQTLELLSARFTAEETASFRGEEPYLTERRLAAAMLASGWQSSTGVPVQNMVLLLPPIIDACVNGHHSLSLLFDDVADCLRYRGREHGEAAGEFADWIQIARRVVEHYASGQSPVASW